MASRPAVCRLAFRRSGRVDLHAVICEGYTQLAEWESLIKQAVEAVPPPVPQEPGGGLFRRTARRQAV